MAAISVDDRNMGLGGPPSTTVSKGMQAVLFGHSFLNPTLLNSVPSNINQPESESLRLGMKLLTLKLALHSGKLGKKFEDDADKSTREQASSSSIKAASNMSTDERNQIFASVFMPPPLPMTSLSSSAKARSKSGRWFSKIPKIQMAKVSTSNNSSSGPSFKARGPSNSHTGTGQSSNISSNFDATINNVGIHLKTNW